MLKTKNTEPADAYLDLIREYPLRRVRNETQHAQAVRMFTRTSLAHQETRDGGIIDYLDILGGLIDEYERAAGLKLDTSHRTPAELIEHLMQANALTVSAVARQIGIGQSNLSEMLSGKRDFSKAAIAKLCGRFGLSPEIFF